MNRYSGRIIIPFELSGLTGLNGDYLPPVGEKAVYPMQSVMPHPTIYISADEKRALHEPIERLPFVSGVYRDKTFASRTARVVKDYLLAPDTYQL